MTVEEASGSHVAVLMERETFGIHLSLSLPSECQGDAEGAEGGSRVIMMNGFVPAGYPWSVPTVCMRAIVCVCVCVHLRGEEKDDQHSSARVTVRESTRTSHIYGL